MSPTRSSAPASARPRSLRSAPASTSRAKAGARTPSTRQPCGTTRAPSARRATRTRRTRASRRGSLGDLVGRKRLFLAGLVIFTTASLLNGLAVNSSMLIGCRALQGLGAALVSPAALSIITTTFAEGAERARALGVWAAIAIGGLAVGLLLGCVMTHAFSWPWIFFVNVPVGIAALILSIRLVPESRDENAHGNYDIGGAVTATGGLMTLVYAIVKTETDGWTSSTTLGLFAVAFVLLTVLLLLG